MAGIRVVQPLVAASPDLLTDSVVTITRLDSHGQPSLKERSHAPQPMLRPQAAILGGFEPPRAYARRISRRSRRLP
jgi:hypothetical protein